VALGLAVVVAALLGAGWQVLAAIVLGALPILNYQMMVPLPRLMNPMRERDALRRPEGAARRALAYRLVWGSSGILITNIAMLGGLVIMSLLGGHLHW
jgi:hypothetical protein